MTPADLDVIEAATRNALESMIPGHLVSAALSTLALTAEVRKLREALAPFVTSSDHTRVFLTSREKMHSDGVSLYDEDVARAHQALEAKEPSA